MEKTKDKFKSAAFVEVPTNAVPHWPKQCQLCGAATDVALLTVYDDRGQPHRGAFSQFGYKDKMGDWLLSKPYTYANWVTRCAEHYGDDM